MSIRPEDVYPAIGYPMLLLGLLELFLGGILLRRSRWHRGVVRSAGTMALAASLFCLSTGLAYVLASLGIQGPSYQIAYRSTWSGWFVTVASLQLVYYLENPGSRFARRAGAVLWPVWIVSFVLVLTTDIFGAHATSLIPCVAESGPLEMAARCLGGATIAWSMLKCVALLFRARGFQKLQLTFFCIGLLSFGLVALAAAAAFQLLGVTSFDPALASFGSVPWVVLTFYACTKYRLFDIKIALVRILIGFLFVAVAACLQLGLYLLLVQAFRETWALLFSFALLATFLLLSPIPSRIDRLLAYALQSQRRYHRLVTEVARAMISLLDLKQLLSYMADSVSECLHVDRIAILLPGEDGTLRLEHLHGRQGGGDPPAEGLGALGQWLRRERSTVLLHREQQRLPPAEFGALRQDMHRLDAQVAVPILFQNRLNGVIALGEKENGEAFVLQDYDALETLAGQAAIAIENARLYELANRDGLTGLYHQSYLRGRLKEEISRSARHGHDLSLVMIDLDRFKSFNDTHGHLVGDAILKAMAKVLNDHAREHDVLARYGGEEFAVLLPETGGAPAAAMAERLRAAVAARCVDGLSVTISAGVSQWRRGLTVDDFIRETDRCLYEAKRQGRNRVCSAPSP